MARWKIRDSPSCDLCGKPEAQTHILWRWESILKTILFYFTRTNKDDVFGDVEGYRSSAVLFNLSIPDIVVIKDNFMYAMELTVCFETNFSKRRNYKLNRYMNLSNEVVGNYAVKNLFLEISSLGFYRNDTKPLIKFLREVKIENTERILMKFSEVAVRASFYLNILKKGMD